MKKKILMLLVLIILIIVGIFIYKFKTSNPADKYPLGLAGLLQSNIPPNRIRAEPVSPKNIAPDLIVFKTKHDFSSFAWVYLSPDKTQVISYPLAKEILSQNPTPLHNEYYTGPINQNTAFVNIKLKTYSTLANMFSARQLYSLLITKEPFKEMYNCGSSDKNGIDYINELIDNGKLASTCEKMI